MKGRPVIDRSMSEASPVSDRLDPDFLALSIEVATLRAEKAGLEARLSDTQAERDRLARMLDDAMRTRSIFRIFSRRIRSPGEE